MIINLMPQGREDLLEVTKHGEVLTVNGVDFDLSPIGEGDTLPVTAIDSHWFLDKVERNRGVLELTLLLPIPWNYSQEQAFPVPLVDVPDGRVIFPAPLPISETESPAEMGQ